MIYRAYLRKNGITREELLVKAVDASNACQKVLTKMGKNPSVWEGFRIFCIEEVGTLDIG